MTAPASRYTARVLLLFGFYVFIVGAIVGSFLNVVIHRYPREESIVFPASRCPHCSTPIKPYDNVPVLSWLLLRGKCRACRAPIAGRYPVVEAANALLWLASWAHLGISWVGLIVAILCSMLLVLIYIDLDIQILPDVVDIPGIGLGFALGALGAGLRTDTMVLSTDLLDSLLGAVIGGGLLLAIALLYKLLRKVEGMGLGDVKMLAMIGAMCGWRAIFPVVFIASLTGAIFGVSLALKNRESLQFAIPFGVFLGMATIFVMFLGVPANEWYVNLVTGSSR